MPKRMLGGSSRHGKVFPNSRYGNQKPKRNGSYIDPQKFVQQAIEVEQAPVYEPTHRFDDFNISPRIKQNLSAKGYETPTPIQDQAINHVLAGRDLVGLAQTGTGKTGAFLIPAIQNLLRSEAGKILVMVPTRELAVQVEEEFKTFAAGLPLRSVLCIGGTGMDRQIQGLRRGARVVIGTPGRLKDLLQQRVLVLSDVKVVVLDEADRMLDMGFIKDIRFLLDQLPAERQSLCFSATVTPDIEQLFNQLLRDPVTVSIVPQRRSEQIEQNVIKASGRDEKFAILVGLLRQPDFDKVMVFTQTKWAAQKLSDRLEKEGIGAQAIHGNKTQPQRQRALNAFKAGQVQVLVATDVAARGIDVPDVSHVINFDQPNTYEDYIHRIGRTGRAGKAGQALTFVS